MARAVGAWRAERHARRRRRLAVLWDRRAYRNLAYVLSAGPLGAIYLTILLTLFTIGMSLLVVLVGVAVLLFMAAVWWWLAAYERELTMWWLDVNIAPMSAPLPPGLSLWQRLQAYARNPITWTSLLYLTLKALCGGLAGILIWALLALAGLLLTAPVWALAGAAGSGFAPDRTGWLVVSPLWLLLGVVVVALTLRLGNWLAQLWGQAAQALLGQSDTARRLAEARTQTVRAQAQAEQAEQSRRELIVNVSHELRTPIASIRGHVESLLMATEAAEVSGTPALITDAAGSPLSTSSVEASHGLPVGVGEDSSSVPSVVNPSVSPAPVVEHPAELKAYLGIVQRETERLGALVDDLLALARGDAGELHLELGPVDGAAVVEEVYGALAELARSERQVTLVRFAAEGLPPIWADRARLAQVLLNLVRNAISYTPAGGIVSLSIEPAGPGQVAFIVADTGIGIAPEDLPQVFDRFYRTDASRARGSGGFGLGLAISRDLVQAMGGTIGVESRAGEGSTFRVLLRTAGPT
ncbi:MAG TPA: ATP-binding protein [Ktedonobacterales bacterium]